MYLRIKVLPKSPKTEIVEEMADGTIKIRVAAPPEKGKANQELIKFLSKHHKVPKEEVIIVSGKSDPLKLIRIKKA
jgi:uncharacterized protein